MKTRLLFFFISVLLFSCGEDGDIAQEKIKTKRQITIRDTLGNPDFEFFCNHFFIPAANAKDEAAFEMLINPELGFVVAYKPTAYAVVNRFASFSDLLAANPDFFMQINTFPQSQKGSFPNFINCDYFSKEGAFFQTSQKKYIIRETLNNPEIKTQSELDNAEKVKTEKLDEIITVKLLVTSSYADFYFAFYEGRWYLAFIDFTKYDCSI